MKAVSIPAKVTLPFANNASAPFIRTVPVPSQIGIQGGAASYTDGFPPVTFQPVGAGGVPPFGADFNGLLNVVSAWNRWQSAGGGLPWDSAFAAAIGGYPQGAVVQALIPGSQWISTVDDNGTNPDTGGAGWSPFGPSSGDAKLTLKTVADYGWLIMDDGTIGNAGSGATTYANASASGLFAALWNLSPTNAPIFTSAGAPTTRGGSAAADFTALKRIALPLQLGRAIAAAGAGAGLTNHTLGQAVGAETSTLIQDNLPAVTLTTTIAAGQGSHVHNISGFPTFSSGASPNTASPNEQVSTTNKNTDAATLPAMTGTTPLGGSALPVAIVPPETFWNVMIKL